MARALVAIGGVVGVTLGGSHARGTADAHSDVDLGVYYRGDLDVPAIGGLARTFDENAEVGERGGWGPWVDGGAWLTVDGTRVDWIYRDLDRVERIRADCEQGRFECHFQVGHPHGFWTSAYVAELALGKILADPGRVSGPGPPGRLSGRTQDGAERARPLGGRIHPRGGREGRATRRRRVGRRLLYRAAGCLSQARHAEAGEWVTTEKGTIAPDLAAALSDLTDLGAALERLRTAATG